MCAVCCVLRARCFDIIQNQRQQQQQQLNRPAVVQFLLTQFSVCKSQSSFGVWSCCKSVHHFVHSVACILFVLSSIIPFMSPIFVVSVPQMVRYRLLRVFVWLTHSMKWKCIECQKQRRWKTKTNKKYSCAFFIGKIQESISAKSKSVADCKMEKELATNTHRTNNHIHANTEKKTTNYNWCKTLWMWSLTADSTKIKCIQKRRSENKNHRIYIWYRGKAAFDARSVLHGNRENAYTRVQNETEPMATTTATTT